MAPYPEIRVASLCAGVGGLDLAIKLALGRSRTVVYVENEITAAAVLAARMADGTLEEAPLWSDLRSFDALPWRDTVDIVAASIPCGPHSYAANRNRTARRQRTLESDKRWLWPHVRRVADGFGSPILFLENVSGFDDAWPIIETDLDFIGYGSVRVRVDAREAGVSHRRLRWFVLAYPMRERREGASKLDGWTFESGFEASQRNDADRRPLFPPGTGRSGAWADWPADAQLAVPGGAHGLAHRLDALRCGGNAVVPLQAAIALRRLLRYVRSEASRG